MPNILVDIFVDRRVPDEPPESFSTNVVAAGFYLVVPIAMGAELIASTASGVRFIEVIPIVGRCILLLEGMALITNWRRSVDGIVYRWRHSGTMYSTIPGWFFRGLLGPGYFVVGLLFTVTAVKTMLA